MQLLSNAGTPILGKLLITVDSREMNRAVSDSDTENQIKENRLLYHQEPASTVSVAGHARNIINP